MPPRRAGTPSRALAGLSLDHPGPAWTPNSPGARRRTPARSANPHAAPRAASPKTRKAVGRRASASPSPAASPKAASRRAPKVVSEAAAESSRRGDFGAINATSRRQRTGEAEQLQRAASPSPIRHDDEYDDDDLDEPISRVGGGWLVNKLLLSCMICCVASVLQQLLVVRNLSARHTFIFGVWGLISGVIGHLWANLLGWMTEDLEIGLKRTVLTCIVDQVVMGSVMAVGLVSFISVCEGVGWDATSANLRGHFGDLVGSGFLFWIAAFIINRNIPYQRILLVCRFEQLFHAMFLASVVAKMRK